MDDYFVGVLAGFFVYGSLLKGYFDDLLLFSDKIIDISKQQLYSYTYGQVRLVETEITNEGNERFS